MGSRPYASFPTADAVLYCTAHTSLQLTKFAHLPPCRSVLICSSVAPRAVPHTLQDTARTGDGRNVELHRTRK